MFRNGLGLGVAILLSGTVFRCSHARRSSWIRKRTSTRGLNEVDEQKAVGTRLRFFID